MNRAGVTAASTLMFAVSVRVQTHFRSPHSHPEVDKNKWPKLETGVTDVSP